MIGVNEAAGSYDENDMNHKQTWHYQLMYNKKTETYAVHEYYYLDDGEHWTTRPIEVQGDSVKEVTQMLMDMLFDITQRGVKEYEK